jgi:diacylglycerol kinase (ATP)
MATADADTEKATKILVVLNPNSGNSSADDVRRAIGHHFSCEDGACVVHELGEGDDLSRVVREALERGVDLVAAAGGDGTVSAVAGALAGSEVSLGIIPLGTANVLARELGIPIDLEGACRLLAEEHAVAKIDAMRVGDRLFFTQLGVGIDSLMIRDTATEAKKRFGRVAYLWTGVKRLIGFQPRRFSLAIDGRKARPRASQVVVANVGTLGQPPFQWGPDIRPDDGKVNVCIVKARTVLGYLVLGWHVARGQHEFNPDVCYLPAEHSIAIASDKPLPVQADGEILGETPVEVTVAPAVVRVAVPNSKSNEQ